VLLIYTLAIGASGISHGCGIFRARGVIDIFHVCGLIDVFRAGAAEGCDLLIFKAKSKDRSLRQLLQGAINAV
jgi:hypothetical protein